MPGQTDVRGFAVRCMSTDGPARDDRR